MGDVKKAAKWVVPLVLAFATGGLSAGGGFWMFASMSAMEGAMLGSALVGFASKKKKIGQTAPVYGLGNPANTQSPHLSIPIIYGKMRVPGNVVYNLKESEQVYKWPVVFCQGEIQALEKVFLNNYGIDEWSGCTSDEYTGTLAQTNDARFPDYLGSLKAKAYAAVTVTASEELHGNATITALVSGRPVPVYDGSSWNTEWSDNFIWVMRDALMTVGGLTESDMGDDATWYAEAQHCDEVVTGEYDTGDNLMLAGTVTDGTNPTVANDGKLRARYALDAYWEVDAAQDETLEYLGKGDLGSVELCKLIRLHLFDGDNRAYYNYKITYSTDDSSYSTLIDRTGDGKNYSGRQDIECDPPISARYFKIYGSGNTLSRSFHVKEFEVFEAVPAKRYRASAYIRDASSAAAVIENISLAAPSRVIENKGKVYVKIDRALGGSPVATFDESNIVADSLVINEIPRREVANHVELKFMDPWQDWNLRGVYASDVVGQEDNGVIKKEILVESIISESQALRQTQLALNLASVVRFYVSFSAGLNAVQVLPGDIIEHDFDTGHWAKGISQYLRVISITENPETGTRTLHCIEHFDALYDDTSASSSNFSFSRTPYKDPLTEPPGQATNLVLSETQIQPGDGAWLPVITVTWSNPGDAWFDHCIVELMVDSDGYREVGQTSNEYFEIKALTAGEEYYVRVRAVSKYGVQAPAAAAPEASITLAGKSSAPSNVTGFLYSVLTRGIELRWNTAKDTNNDLSYYEVRDGASWGAGTVLFTDCKTTKKVFLPTKRTYQLLIRAFDRSGNGSDATAGLSIDIAAPQVSGTPVVVQLPPKSLLVEFDAINSPQIKRYDIHASTTTGFAPSASTLVTQAAGGVSGKVTKSWKATVGNTYFVKVCAIDYLSDLSTINDLYDHASSQSLSKEVVLIDGDDIVADTILTNHLSTTGIDVGGDGDKPIYIRVMDSSGDVIGYVGDFIADGNQYYGGWFEELYVGPEGTPLIKATQDGIEFYQNPSNLVVNGGFEQFQKEDTWIRGTDYEIPGWTPTYTNLGNARIYSRAVAGDGSVYIGDHSLALFSDAVNSTKIVSEKIKVRASSRYSLSLQHNVDHARAQTHTIEILYYTAADVLISTTTAHSALCSSTTFEKISYTGTAPATAVYCTIRISVSTANDGTLSNQGVFDAVQLERGEAVSEFRDGPVTVTGEAGMAFRPDKGLDVFYSGDQVFRVGNIGGLSDGDGGTIATDTMGLWNDGSFYFLDGSGNALFTYDGLTSDAFVAGTIAESVLDTALAAKIPDADADFQFNFAASNTLEPGSIDFSGNDFRVAHGLSVKPAVMAMLRGVNTDTSPDTYSQWHMLPMSHFHSTYGSNLLHEYLAQFTVFVDTTYIRIGARVTHIYIGDAPAAGDIFTLTSTYKTYLYLFDSSNSYTNVWDEIEIAYWIYTTGV